MCLGYMEWVRALATHCARGRGRAGGERARPEFRIEGAKAGVQGMRVRVRARARAVAGVGGGELGAN